jgi:signal transduction histidine kinase
MRTTDPSIQTSAGEHAAIARVFRVASVVWVVLIVALAAVSCWSAYITKITIVKNSAVDSFQKDTVYRHWATLHGGVYVPVTAETPPNPYLAHVPERDISTPSGKKLTLVNPAYMTRQVHTLGAEQRYGLKGHITSLNPIREGNEPDEWERHALLSFEQGSREVFELSSMDGQPYFRFMRPFITEEGCLKCHAAQGYREGDIRGGISVSVPWKPVRAALVANCIVICAAFALTGFLGLAGLRISRRRISVHVARRIQSEQSLREKNDELVGLNRMVSHDLRSPLITIQAYAGYLEKDIAAGDADRIRQNLHFIRNAADSMSGLIEELLWLSRLENEKHPYVETSLQELAGEALELTAGRIAQRGVRVEVSDTPVCLYGDRLWLVRVFQNLIDNAVKFMGEQPDPRITIGAELEAEGVLVSVCDNGVGIDVQAQEKIFEAFNKLDVSAEGSGLGLALVKRIIEMHGGKVRVESDGLGKGACFRFTLPGKNDGNVQGHQRHVQSSRFKSSKVRTKNKLFCC